MQPATESYPKIYLYRRVVQAKLFIDNNFHNPINLDAISDEAYFSKYHFLRLFKKIYGRTPHQHLKSVRIEKSMAFLSAGQSVMEACALVGFESVSSFSGLFRRAVGVSPSEYRERELRRRQQTVRMPLKFVPGCFAEKNGWSRKEQF